MIDNGNLLNLLTAQFSDANRLCALEGDGAAFQTLLVERWSGWEALNAGFRFDVDCLSTDAALPLDDLLGKRLSLLTRLADGGQSRRTGLVTAAECMGADGGLARYRLRLVPWVHLLAQGRHNRVFQDQTVLQIAEAVFARYGDLASWRLSDDVQPFLADVRPRSHCAQYRESDWAFLSRLLAEEGLGFHVVENPDVPAGHTVVIFADSHELPEDAASAAQGGVRFHRNAGTEASDAIQGLGVRRRLGSTGLTWITQDYKRNRAISTQIALRDAIDSVLLECYDPAGPYAFASQQEADRYIRLAADALEAQQDTWLGTGSVRTLRAGTWCGLRQLPTAGGETPPVQLAFIAVHQLGINNLPQALLEHVESELGLDLPLAGGHDEGEDDAILLPETAEFLCESSAPAMAASRLARAQRVGYAVDFRALPRERPWRPILSDGTGTRWNPRPTAPGPQTALVVGPSGEVTPSDVGEVYCDKHGRIRIKFFWQDGSAPTVMWVRVAQRQAGPDGGLQYLPRIGTEVICIFVNGDVDRPLVIGSLFNGQGEGGVAPTPGGADATADLSVYERATDHAASAQGNLAGGRAPPWHGAGGGDAAHRNAAALSGVKSKEFGGSGFNQLAFDDTDGQLRLQFASSQATSQFNAGHLVHQADNYRGSFRGQGWELRTDAWGAVRAESGLLLSSYAIDAGTPSGDATPFNALLKQGGDLLESYHASAKTHLAVGYAAHQGTVGSGASRMVADAAPAKGLLASFQTLVPGNAFGDGQAQAPERSPTVAQDRLPHTGDPLIGLAGKAGLGLVAGQSVQWLAGETLSVASGQQTNWAVAGNLRLHAGQAIGLLAGASGGEGLRLLAGQGPLQIQAQHDTLGLRSRDGLSLGSVNAAVELAAGKRLVIKTAGGASLTIEGGNMTWACPGEIKVHSSNLVFEGPAQLSREMNAWPESRFDREVVLMNHTGQPAANRKFEIHREDGAIIRGTSDAQGKTGIQKSQMIGRYTISIIE